MIVKQEFKKDFVIVSRHLMQDKNLSYKAKALACFLSSLPSEWVIYTKWIATELGMCVREVQRSLKDLVDTGYIKKMQIIDEKTNKFTSGWSVVFLNKESEESKENEAEIQNETGEFENYEKELSKAQEIETAELDEAINSGLESLERDEVPQNSTTKETTKMGLAVLSRTYIRKDFLCNKKDFLIKKSEKNFLIFEKNERKKDELDFKGFDEKEIEKINQWFIYKARLKRKALNAMSKEYQLKKLRVFKLGGQNILAIIDRSIENNWQGLFAIQKRKQSKKQEEQNSVNANEKADLLAYFDAIKEPSLCEA